MGRYVYEDRLRVAEEAARIILEDGEPDYGVAKRKAAQRVGVSDERKLPNAGEIDAAIKSRQSLFGLEPEDGWKQAVCSVALDLMQEFAAYEPRLVGGLVAGVLTPNSAVELHLFSDDAKSIAIHLLNRSVQYEATDKEMGAKRERMPGFEFDWKGVPVEVTVFGVRSGRSLPSDTAGGRPVKRVALKEAKELLSRL